MDHAEVPPEDAPEDERLDAAVSAVDLLNTSVQLMHKTCVLAARTGDRSELDANADFVAFCVTRPAHTRALAKDFIAQAAVEARRLVGYDAELDRAVYVRALELVGEFERRAQRRVGR